MRRREEGLVRRGSDSVFGTGIIEELYFDTID